MTKLSSFHFRGNEYLIKYIETQAVKDGVSADLYAFAGDDTRDLAIVTVEKGYKTPLQKVMYGQETIEGFMSGKAKLYVGLESADIVSYTFPNKDGHNEVDVEVGQTMQWTAEEELTFYEICSPPYEDGRFENLPE